MKRDWEWYLEEFIMPIVTMIAIAWVVWFIMQDGKVEWETNNVPGRVAK